MQVPAECLASARRGRAADLRVIFTENLTLGMSSLIQREENKT